MSTILLVDDDEADLLIVRQAVSWMGYSVVAVERGRDVVERARELKPSVIVLDRDFGDREFDGQSLCRALKADPATSRIPIVLLSDQAEEDDLAEGLDAGADDYIRRSEAPSIILARIQRLARFRRMVETSLMNDRLVQVGRLLAGIVHEIRGPLSVVRGHAELLQLLLATDHQAREWVAPILRNAKLLQVRLTHLMAAVRSGSNLAETVDVVNLIREALDLFGKGGDHRVEYPLVSIEVDPQPDSPRSGVSLDPGKFLLVLLNLLNNASDAILAEGRTGSIVFRVAEETIDELPWVRVDVLDDGPGIPLAVLDRVFEPFFTTKTDGSGYGLYLSSEILTELGGRIEASNRPEGGACFSIRLPAQPAVEAELAGV